MSYGFISLVLHAHLPYVRHPDHDHFLEERWLYEAISETYLPLLRVFNRLKDDGIPFRLTISMSPTLSAMLADELLQDRYVDYCRRMLDLTTKEQERTSEEPEYHTLSRMYHQLNEQNLHDFVNLYDKNITKGFRSLEKAGYLDIITTSATHCFFPLYQQHANSIDVQIHTALISHGRIFGTEPKGMWLAECGYYPGLEQHLRSHGIQYFFTAAHALLFAENRSRYGVYAPLLCENGVAAFGGDIPSSQAVWSADDGYPGDFSYRDYYRDVGFDLPLDYIRPWIHEGDTRVYTGVKYHAITGKSDEKKPYSTAEARRKAEEHAENFLYNRMKQVSKLTRLMDIPPIIVCPYDAELFGHWWFEGPIWLEYLIRKIHAEGQNLILATPADYLSKSRSLQVGTPSLSSWGNNGYAEVWLDGSNDWIYRHIHKAIERMAELVDRYPDEKGLKQRALNQAAREVLLSQASDWPFILKTGNTVPYAIKRLKEHIHNFNAIYDGLCRNSVNTEGLTKMEKRNRIFSDLDYRLFKKDTRSARRGGVVPNNSR